MSAMRGWSAAGVVLVGADLAAPLAQQSPPRRDGVHVGGHAPVPDAVFRSALTTGARDVVELPTSESWLVEVLTDASDATGGRSGAPACTLGVMAGSGGAGATTFATAVAVVSARRWTSALLDLDPLGPGLDRVVGLDRRGVTWDALVSSQGRLGSRSLRAALPDKAGLAVLTWDMAAPAPVDAPVAREVLSAAQRGNEVVVVDLPRALDEARAEVVTRCDRLLMVVEPTITGAASAAKVLAGLAPLTDRVGLVVRRGSSATPPDQLAAALGAPLVCEAPHHRRLGEHVELGLGPVHARRSALARAARTALTAVLGTEAVA
jgi:secretion/DNA translocation related CpaE-like protein